MPASFPSSASMSARPAGSPPLPFEPAGAMVGGIAERKRHAPGAVLPQLVLGAPGPPTGRIGSREPSMLEQRVVRILSNKRITELYLSWMPWQQNALLAGILDRCPTDQLTMIYKALSRPGVDILESAAKSSLKPSGSLLEIQLARAKQLQHELSRAIDAVFKHRKLWRKLYSQRHKQKMLSAAEQSYAARTDLYRYVDPARFSSAIERALCSLLQKSGIAFTYSPTAGLLMVNVEPPVSPAKVSTNVIAAVAPQASVVQTGSSEVQSSVTSDQESMLLAAAPALLELSSVSGSTSSSATLQLQSEVTAPVDTRPAAAIIGSASIVAPAVTVQPAGVVPARTELNIRAALDGVSSEPTCGLPGQTEVVTLLPPLVPNHDKLSAEHDIGNSTAVQPVTAAETLTTEGGRRMSAVVSRDPTIRRFSSDVVTAVMTKVGPHGSDERISETVAETILATAADLGLYDSQSDCLRLSAARARELRERVTGDVVATVLRYHHVNVLQQQAGQSTDATIFPAGTLDSHKITRGKQAGRRLTVTADKLLHRVAKHAVHKPTAAARSFLQMPPVTPEPSLATIASSSKHSATTLDYFPDRPLHKYGGLCRGVASVSGGSSVDVSIPLQAAYKSIKFSYGINEEFLVRPNRKKLAAVYHSQLQEIWQAIDNWQPSDVMTLVVDLVKASSDDILAALRAVLSAKYRLARNINDLPDRLFLNVFKLLGPDDLENAQQVCQQWHYLCSRPEVWMQKCDELGATLGLPHLCARLRSEALAEHDDAAIDWKLCYYELERLLHQSSTSHGAPEAAMAVATTAARTGMAAKDRTTTGTSVRTNARIALHSQGATQYRQQEPTTGATVVPSSDCSGALTEESAAAAVPAAQEKARLRLKPVRIAPLAAASRVQHVASGKSNSVNIDKPNAAASGAAAVTAAVFLATQADRSALGARSGYARQTSSTQYVAVAVPEAEELQSQQLHAILPSSGPRAPEATTFVRAEPAMAALPTITVPHEPGQLDASTDDNLYAMARNSVKVRESTPGLGIEVLAKKKLMIQAGEVALDIRTTLKPVRNMASDNQETQRNSSSPLLEWADPESCNLRDPAIQKRCKAIVKEVCRVRRFQGHLDSINCVAFDKRRAFTGSADHVIFMWDLYSGELVRQLLGHTGSVRCLQLDSSRNILYSGSWDESIIVWDVINFKSTALLLGHEGVVSCLKLSSDGTILASASTDGTLRMWSTTTYSCQRLISSLSDRSAIYCTWFDGLLLAAGGEAGVLHVYDCSTSGLDCKYYHNDTSAASDSKVSAVSLSIAGGSDNVRDDSSSPPDQELPTGTSKPQALTSVAIINDLVVAGLSGGTLCCWDRLSAQVVGRFSLHRGSILATTICYGRLLTAGSDGLVKEWELGTMACVRVLRGHQSAIRAMEVREKDDRIVTVGEDKLVHVWDLRQRKKPPAPVSKHEDHQITTEQALQTWLPTATDNQK